MQLLTAKSAVYLLNLSEHDFVRKKNKFLAKVKAWVDSHGGGVMIPISCVFEKKLLDMPDQASRSAYLKECSSQSCLPKVIKAGLEALNMQCFFTAGTDEVKAWGIQKGTRAPQAAGVIHSDFERGFIMAETMGFADLKELETVAEVKSKGKYKMNGKDYVVQDGDILLFKFNVSPPKKK
eukprot:CAMPEP_0184302146 /NCGR_PEP_ID=MMETSP1049-20130417/12197_1 /TAXON_ID=77928 /ORGANISM="Proteomonas sulcata, Strain CCMP704" /LENGTH=179 /DNA_ID=CAMNT_0026613357 /DNA_START=72 /DNA_END=611 /DNA_ORIENTATION=-